MGLEVMGRFSEWFWSPSVWLPPNVTWEDLRPSERVQYAQFSHLAWPLPLALVIFALRILVERYVYTPFGESLGLRRTRAKRALPNEALEKAYQSSHKLGHKQILGLAKQLDWDTRQVERWIRQRRRQDKPTNLIKFCESGWRFTYYVSAFTFGFYVLWDKSWFWDIKHCWYDYPHHSVPRDIWWYYMLSMAFYWSLTFSHFFDIKRKDFWQMFIHHLTTISLLAFSWTSNLVRIGTLVLFLHDIADVFLEAAKMANYSQRAWVCDIIFIVFSLTWIITRLGIYPGWIMYSTLIEAPAIHAVFPAYYIFNTLLTMLLFLHVFWTYFILKVAYRAFRSGQSAHDTRSSSSESNECMVNGEVTNHVVNKNKH